MIKVDLTEEQAAEILSDVRAKRDRAAFAIGNGNSGARMSAEFEKWEDLANKIGRALECGGCQ